MDASLNGVRARGLPGATWRKSSFSDEHGYCVEVAELPGGEVALRNSRDPEGPALVYTRAEMGAFAAGVKDGEFDWADRDHLSPRSGDAATGAAPAPLGAPASPTAHHQIVDDELQKVADTVLTGEAVLDRAASERLLRVLGAVVSLHRQHEVDARGRCSICRPKSRFPWPRRNEQDACSVYQTLSTHLGHSLALSALRDR